MVPLDVHMVMSVWILSDNILPREVSAVEIELFCVSPSLQMEQDTPPCFYMNKIGFKASQRHKVDLNNRTF